jgi:actin-related protein 5
MFGADDADWAIYRKIVRPLFLCTYSYLDPVGKNTAAISSDEEEDLNQLQTVEQKLLTYDPTFTPEHTHAHLSSRRSALVSAFKPPYEEGDVEGRSYVL